MKNYLGDWKVQSNNSSSLLWNHSKLFIDDECLLKGHYVTMSRTCDLLKSPDTEKDLVWSVFPQKQMSLFLINERTTTLSNVCALEAWSFHLRLIT